MTRSAGRLFLVLVAALGSCHTPPEPPPPKSEKHFRAELAAVANLQDLLPLIERTPDQDVLFEQSLLRMIEIACGPAARRDADKFLDEGEARLRRILEQNPPRTADRLFLALKGLWLDLDLQFRDPPHPDEGKEKMLQELSLLPLARRREGRCGSFAQMYLCLAERLGLPLSYVRMPQHAFIRIEMKGKTLNFETTHPSWARERKNEFYLDHLEAEDAQLAGTTFYLRTLSRREAALDALGDEISAIWLAERRHEEVLRLGAFLEGALGPDAFLQKKVFVLIRKSCDWAKAEVTDPGGLKKALEIVDRLRRMMPNDGATASLQLLGYAKVLKDAARGREIAEEIMKNPRMPQELTRAAWAILNESPK